MSIQRIAILGGGIGALSAAFELTDPNNVPDWKTRYSVTVYTLGWRLGGKGASSRGENFRIEEHGLHVWFGFYENAFTQMRRCYEDLARPRGTPLSTYLFDPNRPGDEAFRPLQYTVNDDFHEAGWHEWPVVFEEPNNRSKPGFGHPAPSWLELVNRAMHWMGEAMKIFFGHGVAGATVDFSSEPALHHNLETALDVSVPIDSVPAEDVIRYSQMVAGDLAMRAFDTTVQTFGGLIWLLEKLQALLHRNQGTAQTKENLFRSYISADMVCTTLLAMLREDVFHRGYDRLDDRDVKKLMADNGLSQLALDSSVLRGAYDSSFAFLRGEPTLDAEVLAAGTGLKNGNRMMFGYKGAFVYLMQAGMGEAVFIPYYEVLAKRGVHFEFFCDVRQLHLSQDHRSIASVSIRRQATLKDPSKPYEPRAFKKRDEEPRTSTEFAYWPPHPNYDQLNEGEEMRRRAALENVDLESYWTAWEGVKDETLVAGQDFDTLVLAIPIQCLKGLAGDRGICHELIAASQEWRDMAQAVETDRTMAAQLWMKPDLAGLGWGMDFDDDGKPDPMILTSYVRPLGTWAVMDHLLSREGWPKGGPRHLGYFCGPMCDSDPPDAPRSDHDFPKRARDRVEAFAREYFRVSMPHLWPIDPAHPQPWDPARVYAEFYRANIDPSERYTLSVAGSTEKRLFPHQSHFDNLILAGDWTRTGLNAGCIESAVMSGMQASRAICGKPEKVVGETDVE